jgi:hypothetical protein
LRRKLTIGRRRAYILDSARWRKNRLWLASKDCLALVPVKYPIESAQGMNKSSSKRVKIRSRAISVADLMVKYSF